MAGAIQKTMMLDVVQEEEKELMANRKQQWQEFIQAVAAAERFPKVELTPPEHGGNMATIGGEVSCSADREEIDELARQKGFLLFAQGLFVPCNPE